MRICVLALLAIPAAFAASVAFCADPVTQENAQLKTALTNYVGSDNSMEAATQRAMMAIMNLASLNIPGAFTNGYKAYDHYINSEKMDEIEARALKQQRSMASVAKLAKYGAAGAAGQATDGAASGVSGGTTFSRLKKDFLYKGEMNDVATEFEKRSGMKREEFLEHMASATDAKLRWDDPQLQQKLETRFNAFASRIPNRDFRSGLETAAGMFPAVARVETLQKLASFYFGNRGPSNSAVADASAEGGAPLAAATAGEPAQEAPSAGVAASGGEVARGLASLGGKTLAPSQERAGALLGLQGGSEALQDLFSPAATGADNESIFKRVSKRYRELTPALLSKTAVLD